MAQKQQVVQNNAPQAQLSSQMPVKCQLAHGSPTGIITGFTNVKELFQKIADCYGISASEILFCTMNTHKVDMSQLITDQKNTEDVKFIFAHIKGQAKEIDVTTPRDGLGLTIADNGVDYAFIKGIDKESILYKHNLISVGDHLEKIEGKSVVGRKHAEIPNMLNDIPKGTTVTIRVVEPLKSGVSNAEHSDKNNGSGDLESGKEALPVPLENHSVVQKNEPSAILPGPKHVFYCQLAHGSPTGIISAFTNTKELYQKIADCYDISLSDILFCTLNTHKVDMDRLLEKVIGLDDLIFAHIKGCRKEIDGTKPQSGLGLTITDNGAGYLFIKGIDEDSIFCKQELISVGDGLEKIDDKSLVGCSLFEVLEILNGILEGTSFTIRVVKPKKQGVSHLDKFSEKRGSENLGSGKEMLRQSSQGPTRVHPAVQKNDPPTQLPSPKLVFHCQLAHGSPIGIIDSFRNVKELYQKIADCYDIPVSKILFCTLNTHKMDMARLLGGNLKIDDFIFAHIKGRRKEIEVTKPPGGLGLTLTDNGAGYSFIKRIKNDSFLEKQGFIFVGDHIEHICGICVVGWRHFEVCKLLFKMSVGTTFTIRVVEPMSIGVAIVENSNQQRCKQTLVDKSTGPPPVEITQQHPAVQKNEPQAQLPSPKLVFRCQLAHGSPMGIISGFNNIKELYQQIADSYDIPASEILFCTINTHRVDMSQLAGGLIGVNDIIFAHIKGRRKERNVTKPQDGLKLIITDNGADYAFIKRIKEGSFLYKQKEIFVGDHIENIDGINLVGLRHHEVAKVLQSIAKGSTFTIRLVEPMKPGYSNLDNLGEQKGCGNLGSSNQTLRLISPRPASVDVGSREAKNYESQKKSISELLLCTLCKGNRSDPITLHCFHSLCKDCFEESIRKQQKNHCNTKNDIMLNCPSCNYQTSGSLKTDINTYLAAPQAIKALLDNEYELDSPVCKSCKKKGKIKPSLFWCVDCIVYYCGECFDFHSSLPVLEKHKTYSLSEIKKEPSLVTKAREICAEHGLRFSKLCSERECVCCESCIYSEHINACKGEHREIQPDIVAQLVDPKVIELKESLWNMLQDLDSKKMKLRDIESKTKELFEEEQVNADEKMQNLRTKLLESTDSLLAESYKIPFYKLKAMESNITVLKQQKSILKNAEDLLSGVQSSSDVIYFLKSKSIKQVIIDGARFLDSDEENGKPLMFRVSFDKTFDTFVNLNCFGKITDEQNREKNNL